MSIAGTGALLTMCWWWATVDQQARWLYRGGFALHACLAAAVIAAARVRLPVASLLSWRPLELLGRISYGVYLFHWPIFLSLSEARTGLPAGPLLALRLAVTIPLAAGSYVLVEQPIRRGERPRVLPAAAARWRVAAPATVVLLVAALLVTTWPPPAPDIVLASLDPTAGAVGGAVHARARTTLLSRAVATAAGRARIGTPPKPLHRPVTNGRSLRIMVVGDSVGITLGRGFELWGRAHGVVVRNVARRWCPLGRWLPSRQGYVELHDLHGCDWTQWWRDEVQSFDPDVVIVAFTIWETMPRRLPAPDGWQSPGAPAFDRWQQREYRAAAATLTARGAHAVWMTVPCGPDMPGKRGAPLWYIDRRTIPRLAASRRRVHVIDLQGELCPDGAPRSDYRGVADARPDGLHYSDAGALAVARWAMPIVLGQRPAPAVPRAG